MPPQTTKVTITLSGNQLTVNKDPAEVVEKGKIKWVKSGSGILDFRILPPNNLFEPSSLPNIHQTWNNHSIQLLPSIHSGGPDYEYSIEYTTSSGKDTLDPKIAVMPPHKKFFFDTAEQTLIAGFVILIAVVVMAAVVRKQRLNRRKNKDFQ